MKNWIIFIILLLSIFGLVWYMFIYDENNINYNKSLPPKPENIVSKINIPNPKIITNKEKIVSKINDFYDIKIEKKEKISKEIESKENFLDNDILKIRELLLSNASINDIDKVMIEFIENSNIPRSDKVYAIWDLIGEIGVENEKGFYLLDYMETLQPIEITQDLIQIITEVQPIETKLKLMDLLYSSTGIANPNIQNDEQLAFISLQISDIQSFLQSKIYNSSNEELFKQALMQYSSMSPPQDSIELLQDLLSKDSKLNISEGDIMSLSLEIALSNNETQLNLLPQIISSMENGEYSHNTHSEFNNMVYSALSSSDQMGEDIISPEAKATLSKYIKNQEPILQTGSDIQIEDLTTYYDWVQAYTISSNLTKKDSNNALALTVFETKDPIKSSAIILLSDPEIMQQIKNSPSYKNLKNSLKSASEQDGISEMNKQILTDAYNELL